mmetsp:Transcript_89009/g.251214  ORF Transcript_89009/g.251214 Transcript_89009/m.251214 type:complete len:365 (-) Transcript_89009:288-1382(-)
MAQWAPLYSHHLRTSFTKFGDFSFSFRDTTKSTAKPEAASRASASSSLARRSASSASRIFRSNSASSTASLASEFRASEYVDAMPKLWDDWPGISEACATNCSPSKKTAVLEVLRGAISSKLGSSSGVSSFFILSFHTLTMSSPHMSFRAATTIAKSLPVSPQTMLGPIEMPSFNFSSKPRTPLPLSKDCDTPAAALGNSSMSVPVSCKSSIVPSGSNSSLTRRTAAMKRRLSGSDTEHAGSLRAIVTSPNFFCSPDPMPKNFILPGFEHNAKMRRCNSSTSSRCSCGRSAASNTRCVIKSKYSRPFDPVYVNSPLGATQSSIRPSAEGRPPNGAAVTNTAFSVQCRAKWLSQAALYADCTEEE